MARELFTYILTNVGTDIFVLPYEDGNQKELALIEAGISVRVWDVKEGDPLTFQARICNEKGLECETIFIRYIPTDKQITNFKVRLPIPVKIKKGDEIHFNIGGQFTINGVLYFEIL